MADGFNLGGKDGGYSFGAALSTYTKKGNKWVFGGEYLLKKSPYTVSYTHLDVYKRQNGDYVRVKQQPETPAEK